MCERPISTTSQALTKYLCYFWDSDNLTFLLNNYRMIPISELDRHFIEYFVWTPDNYAPGPGCSIMDNQVPVSWMLGPKGLRSESAFLGHLDNFSLEWIISPKTQIIGTDLGTNEFPKKIGKINPRILQHLLICDTIVVQSASRLKKL